jgi:hypothetical protein
MWGLRGAGWSLEGCEILRAIERSKTQGRHDGGIDEYQGSYAPKPRLSKETGPADDRRTAGSR